MASVNETLLSYPATPTHDDFFIKSMSDLRVAKELLQQYLPADLLKAIDLDAIEICKDKIHSVNLKSKITDMLYRAPIKHSQQPAYIAVLVEHQSTPRKNMPLRVLAYEAAIMQQHWARYEAVPLVYTIVYYNGQSRWNYPLDIRALIQAPSDLIDRYALKPFQLIELNQVADEELRRSLWAGVMSLAMKHIYDRDILPAFRDFIDLLRMLEFQREGGDYVLSLLYYICGKGEISDENQFQELVATKLPLDKGEKTMTLVEICTQRGFEKGIQQGLHQGLQQGVQQGLQTGEENKSREIARNMLREGLDITFVSKMTGVDVSILEEMLASEV